MCSVRLRDIYGVCICGFICVVMRQHELIIMHFDDGLKCFNETACVHFSIYMGFHMEMHAHVDSQELQHACRPEFVELALYLHDQAARHVVYSESSVRESARMCPLLIMTHKAAIKIVATFVSTCAFLLYSAGRAPCNVWLTVKGHRAYHRSLSC